MAREQDITTKYNLDVSGFKKGISEANKSMKEANAQFKLATAGMDDFSNSSEGLDAKLTQLDSVLTQQNRKLQIYRDQLTETENAQNENARRADELRSAMAQLVSQGISPTSDEYRQYQRALTDVEKEQAKNEQSANDLRTTLMNQEAAVRRTEREQAQYRQTLQEVQQAERLSARTGQSVEDSLNQIRNASQNAETNLKELSSQLSGGIKRGFQVLAGAATGAVAALIASSEASQDHIEDMGKLETAYINAGHSFETGKEAYREFVGLLGETDQSVEAVNHLAKLTDNTEELAQWTDIAAGVYATFGDSLPLEGLTEAANETAKVGKVTGPFADTLNWATMSMQDWNTALSSNPAALNAFTKALEAGLPVEDAFNEALLKMNSEQERSTTITKVLTGLYGEAGKTYQDVNKDLIEARKAQADLTDANAEMGRVVTPVITNVKKVFADFLRDITPRLEDFIEDIDWEEFGETVEDALGVAANGMEWLVDNSEGVTKALKAMLAVFVAKKVLDFTKGISNLGRDLQTTVGTTTLLTNVTRGMTTAQIASTVATNGATVATRLFNAAWRANPVGLVVTGITLLVSGFLALTKATKNSTTEANQNTIAADKLAKKYKEVTKEINENAKARKENIESAEQEGANADFLFERLSKLNDVQDKTNAQKSEMKRLVEELNTLMPELNLKYDEEKDALNMSTEALYQNINAQKELILAKASQENLTEIAKDIAKAEVEAAKATQEHEKIEKNYLKAKEERAAFEKEFGDDILTMTREQQTEYRKLIGAETEAAGAYEKSSDTVNDYKNKLKELNETYDLTANKANEYLDKADISKGLAKLSQQAEEAGREIPEAISQGINDGIYAVPESMEQLDKLITLDNAIKEAGLEGEKIPASISQGVMNGELTVQQAMAKISSNLTLGDKAQKYIDEGKAVPKNLAEGIESGTYTVTEATAIMEGAVNFDNLKKKADDAGAAIPKNLANQVKNGKVSVSEANKILTDSINFDNKVNEAKKTGIDIPKDLANGIKSGELQPAEAINRVQALINYNKMATDADVNGKKIPALVRNGILSGELSVTEANNMMNTWISLKTALTTAGLDGTTIPSTLANKVLNGKLTVEQAVTQMNNWVDFQTALNEAGLSGTEIPKKMQNGILSGKTSVSSAIAQLNNSASAEAGKAPSKMTPIGQQTGRSFANAISNQKPQAKRAGENVIAGVDQGVRNRDKQNSAFSAVVSFGSTLLSRLANSLQEHSPSKASDQFGQWVIEGLGIGMKKKEKGVLSQVTDFGKSVLSNLKNELSENVEIQGMVDNVKSSLNKAKNSINNLNVPQLQLAGVGGVGNNAISTNSTVVNNNFNQTINAPKQPSRAEIYRQTKNLLKLVGGK